MVTPASAPEAPRGATPACGPSAAPQAPNGERRRDRRDQHGQRQRDSEYALAQVPPCLPRIWTGSERYHTIAATVGSRVSGVLHRGEGARVKVLAVLIIIIALVIIIVPQFTNCEYGKDDGATSMTSTDTTATVVYASMESPVAAAAAMPYRMMKCYWAAHAEIVVGVPLLVVGVLLLFARRKETTRALGILTAVLGVLTILIPTSIVGTCLNDQMVCNTEMKPTLLIAGGITVALGIAVVVVGEMKRDNGADAGTAAA